LIQTTPVFHTSHASRISHVFPIPQSSEPPESSQTPQTPQTPQTHQTPQTPPNDRHIYIAPSIQGWIKGPGESNEPSFVSNATINLRISDNYISIVRANLLYLKIEDLEEHDAHHPSQLRQNNNPVGRVMGKVSGIEWRQRRHSKPIAVDFWVTELYSNRMAEQLIFGNKFVKRLRRIAEIGR
jgi:hypothetical protein